MPAQRPRSQKPRARRVFVRSVQIGLGLALAGFIALVVAVYLQASTLPSFSELKSSPNGQMIRVRAADGTVLVSLGPSYGEWLPYDQIPQVMKDAMVSVEDRRFRYHPGVDPIGIARSAMVRVQRGRWVQGGSTITQQLARNLFLSNTRTFGRKAREWLLALAMERKFSKDQILELYLNKVYFGGGSFGIDAAARRFFGHPGNQLSLGEAAVIAGLVKAPSRYSPTADAEAALARAEIVLSEMREAGVISAADMRAADAANVRLNEDANQNSVRYFTDWALPQLEVLIDETVEPLDVWTTLDPTMQKAADAAIRAHTPEAAQGALVALDRDGAVRAMIGGKDYVTSIYNRAAQATRQPGSAFKLFVYLAALEAGYKPEDQVVDEPVTIDGWSPRNNSGRFSGSISLRTAFTYSINTVAAKIGQDVGTGTIADMARRFGISTPINLEPSMVLGTSDVRLIDMTRAYAAVAAKGVAVAPYGITKVTTTGGRVLYRHQTDSSRVLVAPWVAAGMTDLMQSAVSAGTGRAAQIGRPVAGKTGTTSSNKDGWFMGFSSGLTTGVWMGRDDARPVRGLQGGTAPARAFADFMRTAVARRPVEQFETEAKLPEWQLEPDAEAYLGEGDPPLVDEDGNPVQPEDGPAIEDPAAGSPERLDENFIDRALGRAPRDAPVDPAQPRDRPRPEAVLRPAERAPAVQRRPVPAEPVTPR
ncbi:PBP1A family penicillin-binding protein [Sphingomonas changnyeongensis]|uniref:PBP1A family penicillin-binding protein n=1 Tax=Sphingomonas changnyeongensis TaxID=2698679 RepID=A0A7Z2S763_9SPHN|nr:PBP1A family penicillin-binding protein [Sphingomonas changnyeongensis]QHL90061.1 PBP1A family penicillin-binding protein [Sphingomonas changnyeongensis]